MPKKELSYDKNAAIAYLDSEIRAMTKQGYVEEDQLRAMLFTWVGGFYDNLNKNLKAAGLQ